MPRDLSRSRAILIGNAVYDDPRIPDLPAASRCVRAMKKLLTGRLCGWPQDRVASLDDVEKPDDLARSIARLVKDVDDVLLLYYVGHGLRTAKGQLALAVKSSERDPVLLPHTAALYESIVDILRECSAPTKLVILDCCHAELGNKANFIFQSADLVDDYPVDGLYFIGASKIHEMAKAPKGGELTFFTDNFIATVEEGLPDRSEWLALHELFVELRRRMVRKRLPEPVEAGIRNAGGFQFARNAALLPPPPPPPPPRNQAWIAILAVAVTMFVIVLIGGTVYALQGHGATSALSSGCTAHSHLGGLNNNEHIGLVDSSCFTADSDMAKVAKGIEAENKLVVNGTAPYRTVVFFGVMSNAAGAGTNPASLYHLRGVLLAQHHYNNDHSTTLKMRVLLANAGDQFQAGIDAAKVIIQQVHSDPSIVAVIGIGQSRVFALNAIHELESVSLPVISTSVTGELMMQNSNFFRISPGNERQAQMGAVFARSKAHRVMILENENSHIRGQNYDLYSENLASDFKYYFEDASHSVIDKCHYGEDASKPAIYCQNQPNTLLDVPRLRDLICQEKPDLIFFAGRAISLPALFTTPGGSCQQLPTVLGSSDVPKYAGTSKLRAYIHAYHSSLYYLSFAPARLQGCVFINDQFSPLDRAHGTGQRPFQTEPMCSFLQEYRAKWPQSSSEPQGPDNDPGFSFDSSDAMLGYDSLQTVLQVIKTFGSPSMGPDTILWALSQQGVAFNGVSGRVSFSPPARAVPNKPVYITMLDDVNGTLTLQLSCGQFSDSSAAQGPDCPTIQ